MACIKLLIINLMLTASVQAVINYGPGFQHFTPPLPPVPFFGQIKIPIVRVPVPTLQQIKNTIPRPGQLYNAGYIQSSSGFKKDKDGKLVPIGGTYGLINNNGKVQEYGQFQG
ncbi:seroin-like isoform X2 [Choristoneura fumiferana]|uniref:seroin-like isoform X2 n=1 Tax=Choristoneura fumiferana TaxID=7141 RepID=UPI003D15D2BD